MRVDNAVIMAAGTSSRFAPLSHERHKGLTVVRGEVLIERQIRQLLEAGVPEVCVVTGYKADQFEYLRGRFGVRLIHNPDYPTRNNNASIWAARGVLANSYLCSADNYFLENPFEAEVDGAYYASEYADGPTSEWCMTEDAEGHIGSVTVGGRDAWYMMGHAFWDESFTGRFLSILEDEYDLPATAGKLWESIYMEHLDVLKMRIRRYAPGVINEFDTLDELRAFDPSYVDNARSATVRLVAAALGAGEGELRGFAPVKGGTEEAVGFRFECRGETYEYLYDGGRLAAAQDAAAGPDGR